MFEINCHFLDTNVILAKLLPNNNFYNFSIEYFKYDYKRYLSNTVIKEAQNVIFKLKRISLKILSHVKNSIINSNISLFNIKGFLSKIKFEFINKYGDNDFPEGMKKEKFISVVNRFFIDYNDEFHDSIMLNSINNLDILSNEIKKNFKLFSKRLSCFIKRFVCISFLNSVKFIDSLINIGIHKSDAIILEEFSNLSQVLDESIIFITLDKDILRLNDKIKGVFKSNLIIETLK